MRYFFLFPIPPISRQSAHFFYASIPEAHPFFEYLASRSIRDFLSNFFEALQEGLACW